MRKVVKGYKPYYTLDLNFFLEHTVMGEMLFLADTHVGMDELFGVLWADLMQGEYVHKNGDVKDPFRAVLFVPQREKYWFERLIQELETLEYVTLEVDEEWLRVFVKESEAVIAVRNFMSEGKDNVYFKKLQEDIMGLGAHWIGVLDIDELMCSENNYDKTVTDLLKINIEYQSRVRCVGRNHKYSYHWSRSRYVLS